MEGAMSEHGLRSIHLKERLMKIARNYLGIMFALAVTLCPWVAEAQIPLYGSNITLESARKVVAAAEAEARKNSWNVVIAVVDTGGYTVLLQRLDGSNNSSVAVATQKAQTAVAYRRSTKVFEDGIKGGNPQLASLPGVMPIEGGLTLVADGKIIGGIGVSGGTSAQDGQVAKAGAEVFK